MTSRVLTLYFPVPGIENLNLNGMQGVRKKTVLTIYYYLVVTELIYAITK